MANVTIAPDLDTEITGNWTPNTGATLYGTLDEASANDSDFIRSGASPNQDRVKIRLSDPASAMTDPMTVAVRCKASGGTINLAIRLVENTTTIAEWLEEGIATTWTTVTHELTAPQRASISDFTDLYIELEANPSAAPTLLLDAYPNAAFAFSLRKLRNAYAGSAVRIEESGGSTQQDFGFDGSGNFDAAAAATFIGANTGYIVKWYDQSGNGNDIANTAAGGAPIYAATGLSSLPAVKWPSTTAKSLTRAATSLGAITQCSYFAVWAEDSDRQHSHLVHWNTGTKLFEVWGSHSTGMYFDLGTDTTGRIGAFAPPAGWSNNTGTLPHVVECYRDAVDLQDYVVNGTSLGSATRTADRDAEVAVLAFGDGNRMEGFMSEAILWTTDLGSTNRAAVRANLGTYYGITVS